MKTTYRTLGRTAALALPLASLTICGPRSAMPLGSSDTLPAPSHATKTRIAAQVAQLPIAFEPNVGQAAADARFVARGPGYAVQIGPTTTTVGVKATRRRRLHGERAANRLHLRLVGANASAAVAGEDPLPGRSSYLKGRDPAAWKADIPTYARVRVREIYPGVDVVYYGRQHVVEHDFILAPGADVKRVRFETADTEHLDARDDGALVTRSGDGELALLKPVAYQEIDGDRRSVSCQYVRANNTTFGFAVGDYDHARPLVIDPILKYSTYLGGTAEDNDDVFGRIGTDKFGFAYIAGETDSLDYPVLNAFQPEHAANVAGDSDGVITKLNKTGTAIVYSTYFGGTAEDGVEDLAVDPNGNAYVTVFTGSADFPVTPGAYQTTFAGGDRFDGDVVAAKFDPTGHLLFSTYLGGSGNEFASGIAIDGTGAVYLTGCTASTDFPVSATAFQKTMHGSGAFGEGDAFIAKLDPRLSSLVYSTYLGGSDDDCGIAISVRSKMAYVAGSTVSTDFPVTPGVVQPTFGGGDPSIGYGDNFITKINTTGTKLVYSTYLGGNDGDFASDLALDRFGNAYLVGETLSANFPVTAGAFQTTYGGAGAAGIGDGFVSKLNTTATALVYSTYLGGSDDDLAEAVGVDTNGNAYVVGGTSSTDFPVTPDAIQSTLAGGDGLFVDDGFVTRLNAAGSAVTYSTYFGGTADEEVDHVRLTGHTVYIVGTTFSADLVTTPGAFDRTYQGFGDMFIAKMVLPAPPVTAPDVMRGPARAAAASPPTRGVARRPHHRHR
jgi:hypothetical protein